MRRLPMIALVSALLAGTAAAGSLAASPPVAASSTAASPLAACTADNVASQTGTVFMNSEVEPSIAANPTDASNLVGAYQQDRWSDGGARGNVVGVSDDGGASWTTVTQTYSSLCTGGNAANGGDFQRATDPWVTFGPTGIVYQMHLSFNSFDNDHALLATRSTDGGHTWSLPETLLREEDINVFSDKNSMTADPNDEDFVYAVWDRLEFPIEKAQGKRSSRAFAFFGPIYFTRTTNATTGFDWEPAREILPTHRNTQTIGNQIAVLPDLNNSTDEGQLVNIFNYISIRNKDGRQRFNVGVIRSEDRGSTWSDIIFVDKLQTVFVRDPDDGTAVRTGDIIPDIAVNPNNGNVYAVWQDARFNSFGYDGIVFSRSNDGGLSWSDPVEINKTPNVSPVLNRQAFTPAVHVAADGTIGVTYYDFRNNGDDPVDADGNAIGPLETDYFMVHCHSACTNADNWAETKITSSSFDMRKAPVARGYFVGDYEGLDASGDTFRAFFSQALSTADPATVFSSSVGAGP
jgi:hypothetical protein